MNNVTGKPVPFEVKLVSNQKEAQELAGGHGKSAKQKTVLNLNLNGKSIMDQDQLLNSRSYTPFKHFPNFRVQEVGNFTKHSFKIQTSLLMID